MTSKISIEIAIGDSETPISDGIGDLLELLYQLEPQIRKSKEKEIKLSLQVENTEKGTKTRIEVTHE